MTCWGHIAGINAFLAYGCMICDVKDDEILTDVLSEFRHQKVFSLIFMKGKR